MHDERPQLLLVEEDEVLADVTAFRLELLGYGVQWVNSGKAAKEQIAKSCPHLILLDTYLPDIDGIDFINQLSSDPETSMVPILVFSTDANLNSVQRAVAAGAKDYLVTPYDPSVLEEKIETLLALAQQMS